MPHVRYPDLSTWRLKTPGGIPVKVVSRSGLFHAIDKKGGNEHTVTEVILIPSTRLLDFVREWYPPPVRFGNQLVFLTKQFDGLPIYADEIRWESHLPGLPIDPFLEDTDAIGSDTYAPVLRVTILYRARLRAPESQDPRNFLEVTANATGEYLNIGTASACWYNNRATTQVLGRASEVLLPITVIVPMIDWTVRVPSILFSDWKVFWLPNLRRMMGHVNSEPATFLFDAIPESLLLAGFVYREKLPFDPDSIDPQERAPFIELEMKFIEKSMELEGETAGDPGRKIGWNDYYRPGFGWKYLKVAINGNKDNCRPIYPLTDFEGLFAF